MQNKLYSFIISSSSSRIFNISLWISSRGLFCLSISVLLLSSSSSNRVNFLRRKYKEIIFNRAILRLSILWLVAGCCAAAPFFDDNYFGEHFYGTNGVCLSVHIHEPRGQVCNFDNEIDSPPTLNATRVDSILLKFGNLIDSKLHIVCVISLITLLFHRVGNILYVCLFASIQWHCCS